MSVVVMAKGHVLLLFCLLSFESIPHFEFVSYFLYPMTNVCRKAPLKPAFEAFRKEGWGGARSLNTSWFPS